MNYCFGKTPIKNTPCKTVGYKVSNKLKSYLGEM